MRADGGEAGLIDAQLLGQLRAEFAAQRARAVELRENFTRQAQRADRLPVPVLCSGVIEHGGRCVGVFRLCLARQEEAPADPASAASSRPRPARDLPAACGGRAGRRC